MYYVMTFIAAVIGRLSPRTVEILTRAIAILIFDVARFRRGLILKNLGRVYGTTKTPAELRQIGRDSIYNFLLTAMEFLRSGRHDIAANVELKGLDHIRSALAQQRGAYILCFHMGNWEAMGAACTRHLTPSHVLVKKLGRGGVERFVSEFRARNGFLAVRREKKGDGLIAIREGLSKGHIIGFVMDQARPGEPRLPFFGQPAKTNTSLAAIWRRIQAPIVPAYAHRTALGHHIVEYFPELEITKTSDEAGDVLRHSAMFNQVIERHILAHPDQYFWMHDRWK